MFSIILFLITLFVTSQVCLFSFVKCVHINIFSLFFSKQFIFQQGVQICSYPQTNNDQPFYKHTKRNACFNYKTNKSGFRPAIKFILTNITCWHVCIQRLLAGQHRLCLHGINTYTTLITISHFALKSTIFMSDQDILGNTLFK